MRAARLFPLIVALLAAFPAASNSFQPPKKDQEKDKEAAKQALLDRKKPAASFAGKVKTQEATLEATIPANTGFAILLGGASKNSQVKVKVTGR